MTDTILALDLDRYKIISCADARATRDHTLDATLLGHFDRRVATGKAKIQAVGA